MSFVFLYRKIKNFQFIIFQYYIFYSFFCIFGKLVLTLHKLRMYIKSEMKKILIPFFFLIVALFVGSCSSMRHYTYFQNIDTLDLSSTKGLPEIKIMPKDELTIIVKTSNPEAAEPFNLNIQNTGVGMGTNIRGYLVDNNGNINFPVLGRIHVGGLTKPQVEDTIAKKIKPYLAANEHPVVICRMSSFNITMIGEAGPTVINVPTENMNIVEALARGGDIKQYGKRYNILLVREDSTGEKHIHRYNMNDARIFSDPYYYLQQNDIVYVEPTRQRTVGSSMGPWTTFWLTLLGWATTAATLVLSIVK